MKKHIEKKFLMQTKLPDDVMEVIKKPEHTTHVNDIPQPIKDFPKEYHAYAITGDNIFFKTFAFEYQGAVRFIPEPDPVLVYFDSAYNNYKLIADRRKEILKSTLNKPMGEPMIKELYSFYSLTSSFVIFLFTSIEAFINRTIPTDFVYTRVGKRSTETFTKRQIEEWLPFDEKIKDVLPKVTGKQFSANYPSQWSHICQLKEYRDAIVHTKTAPDGGYTYDHLYKKAFLFNFEETINAVKDFCNFYSESPDYITECSCGNDW
jgi:hypothetical protein